MVLRAWAALCRLPFARGRLTVGGILCRLVGSRVEDLEFRYHGTLLSLDLRDANCRMVLFNGYERLETALLMSQLRPGDVVLDIGAHVGALAAACAEAVGPTGAVHAFEAHPGTVERLRKAAAASAGVIRVTHAAVVDPRTAGAGSVEFFPNAAHPSWSTLQPALASAEDAPARVPAVSVDEFVSQRGIQRVALVKIDVEGAEMRVLAGMTQLLSQPVPAHLFIEVKPDTWSEPDRLRFLALRERGYTARLVPPSGSPSPIALDGVCRLEGTFNVLLSVEPTAAPR